MDHFSDGTLSIIQAKQPGLAGWREVPVPPEMMREPRVSACRAFFHDAHNIAVFSTVEFIDDGKVDGPEYHLSMTRQYQHGLRRCSSTEARWVLVQFRMPEAVEDNHVPNGLARNFWRPVADNLVGRECLCVESENAIREDKGDYVWRA